MRHQLSDAAQLLSEAFSRLKKAIRSEAMGLGGVAFMAQSLLLLDGVDTVAASLRATTA